MTKVKQQRPRLPYKERRDAPFWLAAVKQKRAKRLTDTNWLPKGGS